MIRQGRDRDQVIAAVAHDAGPLGQPFDGHRIGKADADGAPAGAGQPFQLQ